jgi:hypothetical protein
MTPQPHKNRLHNVSAIIATDARENQAGVDGDRRRPETAAAFVTLLAAQSRSPTKPAVRSIVLEVGARPQQPDGTDRSAPLTPRLLFSNSGNYMRIASRLLAVCDWSCK